MFASYNIETRIAFSDFNLDKQTIKVVIYSKFRLSKNADFRNTKYGLVYVTTTYNFKTNKASNTFVQSSFPTLDNNS